MSSPVSPHQRHLIELNRSLDEILDRAHIGVVYSADPQDPSNVRQKTIQPRSWKSYRDAAEQVVDALRARGAKRVDLIAEGVELQSALANDRFDLLWLNCGGVQGRGSMAHTPSLCESLGVPYVGHSPLQAALMDDKAVMKQWLRGIGLPTAPFVVRFGGRPATLANTDADFVQEFGRAYHGPFLVKPAQGRGSVMVKLVETISEALEAAAAVNSMTQDRVLIEQFVAGQEYCVWASGGSTVRSGAVVGEHRLSVFGASERLFLDQMRIFVKQEKQTRVNDLARRLSASEEALHDGLSHLARSVYEGLSLSVPIRIHARRDASGLLQILEVNPKPDLRRPQEGHSGLLKAALDDLGLSFEDLFVKMLADWFIFHQRVHPGIVSALRERMARGPREGLRREPQPEMR